MEGLQELTHTLSDGTIPDHLCPPFTRLECPKLQLLFSEEQVELWASNLAGTFTVSVRTKAH